MDDKLARLKEIGFTQIGRWLLIDGQLNFELNAFASARNVLYAFTVDGRLMYVGKTVQALKSRMAGYKNPGPTQSTNINNKHNICEYLAQEKRVEIYVLPDSGLFRYGGFHLNMAAGLEDSLIRDLEPSWNGGRKEAPDESLQPTQFPSTDFVDEMPIRTSLTANDFRGALFTMFSKAAEDGSTHVEVNAGQLHRRMGGYPGTDHRMPVCCGVMYAAMNDGDRIIEQPPKGKGASLIVRYVLPRKTE